MKFIIIIFIFIRLVYSGLHKFMTIYTEIHGQTTSGFPEFSAVSTLDDHQIDYYDSEIKKLIPKQNWVKEITSTELLWQEYTENREHVQQIYRNNTRILMEIFNHSDGVHTYQGMCGCEWDDKTGDSHGFDRYAYHGDNFISLDLKENRYITSVQQAKPTVKKWNNDREQLEFLKQYYDYKCVYRLKEFLYLSKATFKKTEPKVSLLQKSPDYYVECHVTGFLFRNTSISWRKNGQAMSDSSGLTSGDTLPNGDGTFQRRVTLYVLPGEWKMNQFSCVVEHESLTETIQTNLAENKIKRNKHPSDASNNMYLLVILPVTVGLIVLFVLWKLCKNPKRYPAQVKDCRKSPISPPNACSSPTKAAATHGSFSEIPFQNFHSSSPSIYVPIDGNDARVYRLFEMKIATAEDDCVLHSNGQLQRNYLQTTETNPEQRRHFTYSPEPSPVQIQP